MTSEERYVQALDYCVEKTRLNLDRLDAFPHWTRDGVWRTSEHGRWTGGFWIGIVWLAYLRSGDPALLAAAEDWTKRLEFRKTDTTTHDMGFLFYPSFVRGFLVTGDPYYRDVALVVPGIMEGALQAEKDGADAVIIDCMSDPGLYAARELVRIPVVGPAQASMHLAAMLGHRFSVLTVFDHDIPAVEERSARYGLSAKLASARAFDIPVLALEDDIEGVTQVLIDLGEQAVREDGAHVLIPGCTGLVLNRRLV